MTTLRVLDLFAGCGGLTQGFVATGMFRPVGAVEIDHSAAATYAQNFGHHIHVGDIAEWVDSPLPTTDVVVGGPPCQGFSALGKRDPRDPRNGLWRHYLTTLQRVRPSFFVLENVPGFLKSNEYQILERETRRDGRLADYALEPAILNSALFGAPQNRRRAVVIGRLRGFDPVGHPPASTPTTLADTFPRWLNPRVVETELPESSIEFMGRDLPGAFKTRDLHITRVPTELSLARYRSIPAGGNRHDLPDHLLAPCWRKHKDGAGDVMGRLTWGKPSVTIRTEFFKPEKGRYLHPDENRPITHAEAATIQG